MSLSAKIAIAISCIIAVGVLVVTAFSFYAISSDIKNSVAERQLETAKQTIDKVERLINEQISAVSSMAALEASNPYWTSRTKDPSSIERDLEKLIYFSGPWHALKIVDRKRNIVADRTETGHHDDALSDEENRAHAAAAAGNTYVGNKSNNEGEDCIIIAAPIRVIRESGPSIEGIIIGRFPWQIIVEVLNTLDTRSALVDSLGNIIGVSNNLSQKLIGSKVSTSAIRSVLSFNNGFLTSVAKDTISGTDSIVSYAPELGFWDYKGNNWGLVLEKPLSELSVSASVSALNISTATIIVFIVVIFVLLHLLNSLVIHPLRIAINTVSTISKGDLSVRIKSVRQDELGELSNAIDGMANTLDRYKEELEERVEERTKELVIRTSELEKMNKYMVDRELRMMELKKEILEKDKKDETDK